MIAQEWTASQTGRHLEVSNPATGATFASVPDSTAKDAAQAADAAAAAFPTWSRRTARERAQLLKRWHALILEHQEDLARIISTEQGKPIKESRGGSPGTAPPTWNGSPRKPPASAAKSWPSPSLAARCWYSGNPVGVVAAITPWNFPLRHDRPQDRPGAGRRLHGRRQAGRRHAADRARPGLPC
ncbi:aldehyde dehydrogenase family protein [Cupriavidus basilensis]